MARDKSSGSGGDKCGDIDALEARYRTMVKGGKAKFPLAADNLDYWLSGKGGTKTIDKKYFVEESKVKSHLLDVHRPMFLSETDAKKGIVPRVKKDKKAGKEYTLTWEDSMYASLNSNLFFALGGFTLISEVKIKVVEIKGKTAKVKFSSWKCSAKDVYNWDKGKSVVVPFFGKIDDEEALCLEKAGRAKSYGIKTEAWYVKDAKITADGEVEIG